MINEKLFKENRTYADLPDKYKNIIDTLLEEHLNLKVPTPLRNFTLASIVYDEQGNKFVVLAVGSHCNWLSRSDDVDYYISFNDEHNKFYCSPRNSWANFYSSLEEVQHLVKIEHSENYINKILDDLWRLHATYKEYKDPT